MNGTYWIVVFILLGVLAFGCSESGDHEAGDGDMDSEEIEQPQTGLSRQNYLDRLRGMWIGECLANWTGITTEGQRQEPPFYTDEDWQTDQGISYFSDPTIDFRILDPWLSDDDTNIEYVYVHLMSRHDTSKLTARQITDGWRAHINDWIWVSNARARELMEMGVAVPASGLPSANEYSLYIDAQLTTEVFGAMAPGMPRLALEISELPIRATAHGYAAHAAQFFVLLYALAPLADQSLSMRDQILWLVAEASNYIPESSKTQDVIAFVLSAYTEAAKDGTLDDWEAVRDAVAERYQLNAQDHGYLYREWTESTVNFATGLLALLFGEGDFRRTVQIGTLSGWDSDNGTATMGGLLGLMLGLQRLAEQFPGEEMSDRYDMAGMRDNLPDHAPDDSVAEDNFTLLAGRMLDLVEKNISDNGGSVTDDQAWDLPVMSETVDPLQDNPLLRLSERSANNRVRNLGGQVTVELSSGGKGDAIADGVEHDFSGREWPFDLAPILGIEGGDQELSFAVRYDRPVAVHTIRFIEGGPIISEEVVDERIGAFAEARVEIRVDGQWQEPSGGASLSEPLDPDLPFQIIDFVLNEPAQANGIRLIGTPSQNDDGYVTIAELDALAAK